MKKAWVKFCGTTNYEDAELAWSLNADAIGFIFVERSPRKITPEEAGAIAERLARPIERIGVVADESLDNVASIYERAKLTGIQLHGHESAEMVHELRRRVPDARVIKAVRVRSGDDLHGFLSEYDIEEVDNLLLDTHVEGQLGGTGVRFDWKAAAEILRDAKAQVPVIVAGGLTAENVAEAVETLRPFGVDVASGVEREPGRKDAEKMRAFIRAACGDVGKEVA